MCCTVSHVRLVSLKTSQAQCCFALVLSKILKGFHGYVPRSAKAAMGGPSLCVPMFQMRQGHESCYFKLFSETTQLRAEVLVRFSKNAHFRSQSREMYHVSSCFRSGEFLYMRLCCVHNIFKECACGQHTRFFVFEMSQSAQNALSAVEPTQQFTATMSVPCLT